MAKEKIWKDRDKDEKDKGETFGGTFEFTGEMPLADVLDIDPTEARSNPEKQLANAVIRPGAVVFDPFKGTDKEKSIEDQIGKIEDMLASGEIDADQALTALSRVYTVNHSVGRDILYDRRLKPENRVNRYVAYAMAHGLHEGNIDKIKKYAVMEIARQRKVAGNWGTVTVDTDIRKQR